MNTRTITLAAFLTASLAASAAVPYKFGLAGFTFHKQTLDQTLATLKRIDVHYLCVKDFHLRYDSDDAAIAAFKAKCAAAGVTGYGLGPLYTKNNEEVRKYFEFAKRYGAKVIVGVPYEVAPGKKDKWSERIGSRSQLEYIDKLVKEFDIRYAIHNHGPQAGKMFPDVEYGWNLVKDLDPRIGFCLDVGWEYGCGKDPVRTIRQYGDRIFDIHFKNFEIGKPNGAAIPISRGKINFVEVMRALAEVGYDGVCSLEYERDFEDNAVPIAECAGYFRGVADTLRVKARMEPVPQGANTLTPAESADGWKLLWDGKTSAGWVGVKSGCKTFPAIGWKMDGGALTMTPQHFIRDDGTWGDLPPEDMRLGGGGDIVTERKFRDFAFKFDFRMTDKANSGVKYFYDETVNQGTCEEYQVLDNGHPDYGKGRDGNRKIAALYDLIPAPLAEKAVRGVGKWNTGMIVAKGPHVEHWLNGVKVLEYERGTAEFKATVKASKYATWGKDAGGAAQDWGETAVGRILLQDHSDSTVSFCNLKIKEL